MKLDRSWAVVRSVPKKEIDAAKEMTKRGMTAYCPIYRYEHKDRRTKKLKTKDFPLFVGWLFVRADSIDWYALTRCKSVAQILTGPEGNPICVEADKIEEIRANVQSGKWDKLRVHGAMVKPGVKVKVDDVNLGALQAVVASVKNERAVGLIVHLFNREVSAQISVDRLLRKD